jgi:hypothetical protein
VLESPCGEGWGNLFFAKIVRDTSLPTQFNKQKGQKNEFQDKQLHKVEARDIDQARPRQVSEL